MAHFVSQRSLLLTAALWLSWWLIMCDFVAWGSQPTSLGDRLIAGIWTQNHLPLTVTEAQSANWTQVAPTSCLDGYGHRWRLGTRLTPTLMYDNTGHLAGMQIVIDSTTFPLYPESNLRPERVVVVPGGPTTEHALSLYFMEPRKICSAVASDHTSGSIGDRLWVRKGAASQAEIDFDVIPLVERDLIAGSPANGWTAGGCAPSGFAFKGSPGMGRHYWQYLFKDQVCVDAGPLFLLYDRGRLGAFGFTFVGTNQRVPTVGGILPTKATPGSPLAAPPPSVWEFARQPLYPFFFHEDQNPTCLQNLNMFNSSLLGGAMTTGTLHVFVSDPFSKQCAPAPAVCDTTPASSSSSDRDIWVGAFVATALGCCVLGTLLYRGARRTDSRHQQVLLHSYQDL